MLVKPGDHIEVDTPLITLETDKATMDVPSTAAGEIIELLVQKGARISKGSPLARLRMAAAAAMPSGAQRSRRAGPGRDVACGASAAAPPARRPAAAPVQRPCGREACGRCA